ncbi:MAG: alpha/beta hydrolase [Boseongicola sp. SB0662_bin_57]|nr:alpha/beta hydrolase [Boseongicola sp. SB0662_bin_57]
MPGDYDLPADMPGFAEAQAEMSMRSRETATLPGARFDVAYGPRPRQRLDVFPAGTGTPAHLFFRGGYWRLGEKEDRRFPATAWIPRGVAWIVPNYRLAPEASLPGILEDAQAAFDWVISNAETCGIDRKQVHLSGNSAGAQLAAMVAARTAPENVASLTLISGLYDLQPLLEEEPNGWLNLDVETACAMSPVHHLPPPELPVTVSCGGAETEAFRLQSREFAEALRANGNPVDHFESPGQNHMEIITEIGTPGTPVFAALERRLEECRSRLDCP